MPVYVYGIDRVAENLVPRFHHVIKQELCFPGCRVIFAHTVFIGSYPEVPIGIFGDGVDMFYFGIVAIQVFLDKAIDYLKKSFKEKIISEN